MENERKIRNRLTYIINAAQSGLDALKRDDEFDLETALTDLEGETGALAKDVRGEQRATNVDIVTGIMNFSRHGALAQLFVVDALTKWSEKIASVDPAEVDSPMLSGKAWVSVAKEIKDKLDAAYKAKA